MRLRLQNENKVAKNKDYFLGNNKSEVPDQTFNPEV
jgi:hypothetical protein